MSPEAPSASAAPLDTNPESDMSPDAHLQLSPPWSLPQHWQIRFAIPLGPKPNSMLHFQASVPRGLSPKTSRLGALELHCRCLLATQQETSLFGAVQNPQSWRNLHAHMRTPPHCAAP